MRWVSDWFRTWVGIGITLAVLTETGVMASAAWQTAPAASQPAAQSDQAPPAPPATVTSGHTVLARIALGFVLITVGAGALITAASYWRPSGFTLLWLGLFMLSGGGLYVLSSPPISQLISLPRLWLFYLGAFLLYFVNVPGLLYLEQIQGRGWRSSTRRLWQIGLLVAIGCSVYDMAAGRPYASAVVCRVFMSVAMAALLPQALLSARHDWVESGVRIFCTVVLALTILHSNLVSFGLLSATRVPFDIYGMIMLILGVGFVTSRRVFADQRELTTMEHEMKTAKSIQSSILPHTVPTISGIDLAVRYQPMRAVAGDLYDFLRIDDRCLAILIGDVTGHGVPAALIASMLKAALLSQAAHANDPSMVLAAINRVICGQFDTRFVTAAYLVIDVERHRVRYSLAGHVPPLLRRGDTGDVVALTEGGLVLGWFPDSQFPTAEVPFEPGDRLLLYTDGLTDATLPTGEWFGDRELLDFVRTRHEPGASRFAGALVERLEQWSGRGTPGLPFEDDLTIVVVDATNG